MVVGTKTGSYMSTEEELKLIEQLIFHEGEERFPYVDTVGKITIGVGRNLTDRGLSRDEVRFLLKNDIDLCKADLDMHLPWWRNLNEVRQRVLIDMCFNLGITRLMGFKTTLALIEAGEYQAASLQMLRSKWAKQVKGRALRLAKMMEEG